MKHPVPIALIVPVYNCEVFLRPCLDSIFSQSVAPLEVILIDDGSTDSSGAICDEYLKEFDNCQVIHEKNSGVSHARNIGLDAIKKSKYVAFVDSDDVLHPLYCEILYKNIVSFAADVSCSSFTADESSFPSLINGFLNTGIKVYSNVDLCNDIFTGSILDYYLWNKLYCLDVINTCNIRFDECVSYWEDLLFNCMYFSKIKKGCVLTEDKLYLYRQNQASAVHCSPSLKMRLDQLNVACKTFKILKDEPYCRRGRCKSLIQISFCLKMIASVLLKKLLRVK